MTSRGLAPIVALVMVLAVVVSGQPVMNGTDLKNIVHTRERIVANVDGYVEFASQNFTRQPLDFSIVEQDIYETEPEKKYLGLIGHQFVFDFAYVHQDKGKPSGHYQFSYLTMLVRNPRYWISTYSPRCHFEEEFTIALPDKSRYSCQKEQTHRCISHPGQLVANVVLRSFELELEGNPEKVDRLEFSKPAWEESCEQWSK